MYAVSIGKNGWNRIRIRVRGKGANIVKNWPCDSGLKPVQSEVSDNCKRDLSFILLIFDLH